MSKERERRGVVERAVSDIEAELLRLRPALAPLDAAKGRLRRVLEAIATRGGGAIEPRPVPLPVPLPVPHPAPFPASLPVSSPLLAPARAAGAVAAVAAAVRVAEEAAAAEEKLLAECRGATPEASADAREATPQRPSTPLDNFADVDVEVRISNRES